MPHKVSWKKGLVWRKNELLVVGQAEGIWSHLGESEWGSYCRCSEAGSVWAGAPGNVLGKTAALVRMCMHAKSFQLCLTLCDPITLNVMGWDGFTLHHGPCTAHMDSDKHKKEPAKLRKSRIRQLSWRDQIIHLSNIYHLLVLNPRQGIAQQERHICKRASSFILPCLTFLSLSF